MDRQCSPIAVRSEPGSQTQVEVHFLQMQNDRGSLGPPIGGIADSRSNNKGA